MSAPRVSVVIPTHARPEMLGRLLDSLAAQTLPAAAFEVIVVATPGDPGEAVAAARAEALELRCVVVPDDPTGGRSPSLKRNYGASLARAPVLAFTDDDCVARPGWLEAGLAALEGADAVEGQTRVPAPARRTLMAKLLTLLEAPGGYQTCNIFYRRSRFEALGGFDPALPFYLEDTDVAWSLLEAGGRIAHAPEAVIEHPVKPPDPWQLLRDARRVIQVPYLRRKHPAQFRAHGYRALTRAHWPYLALYAAAVPAGLAAGPLGLAAVGGALGAVWVAHGVKVFWGCRPTAEEVAVTALLLPVVPAVRAVQLLRGNLRHGVWLWT